MRTERGWGGEQRLKGLCLFTSAPLPYLFASSHPSQPKPKPWKSILPGVLGSVGRMTLNKPALPGTTPRGALEVEGSERSSWHAAPLSFGGLSLGLPEKGPPACRSSGFIQRGPGTFGRSGDHLLARPPEQPQTHTTPALGAESTQV